MLARDIIALYAHLGDIKEDLGNHWLVMAAVIALLQEKGIIGSYELHGKMVALDRATGDRPA